MGGPKRIPGPLGLQAVEKEVEERNWFDQEIHADPQAVSSKVSFQRVGPGFLAPTQLRVRLEGKETALLNVRGNTGGKLTISYYLYPLEEGRFFSQIMGAEFRAHINIEPAADFPKFDSPECAKIYAKFHDAELKPNDRNAALRKFFKGQLKAGKEPTTLDTLPRICTLHHEAGHVRHAENNYWALKSNFQSEASKLGSLWSTRSPNARYLDLAKRMWSSWWSDYNNKEHEEIVYEECKLFINLYEKNRERGFKKPLRHVGTNLDEYALYVLNRIGGTIE